MLTRHTGKETHMEATLSEVQREVLELRAMVQQAETLVEKIGRRLKEAADDYDWCERYDEEIERIDDGSHFATLFVSQAKREPERVVKTFRLVLNFMFKSESYDYSVSAYGTDSQEGTYLVPEGKDVSCVNDLDDDAIEHIRGVNLVDWAADAKNLEVSVSVEEGDFEES